MKNKNIINDKRLVSSFYEWKILENYPKNLIISSHLGCPNGKYIEELSLKPLINEFKNKI